MKEAESIAEHINDLLPNAKSGSLRFFGNWFGRPYDNQHTIRSAKTQDDLLVITFDGKETLSIWNPKESKISEREFYIKYASRVLWEWYYYGRSPRSEDLCYIDYVVENGKISTKTNRDRGKPEPDANVSEPAVKIYSFDDI